MKTAVEWLYETLWKQTNFSLPSNILEQAKEMERQETENKAIHFAEWLTKKHPLTLMALYEQFKQENNN